MQDMAQQFAGQEVSLAVLEVARASRKVVCSVAKAKENDELRQLEVGRVGWTPRQSLAEAGKDRDACCDRLAPQPPFPLLLAVCLAANSRQAHACKGADCWCANVCARPLCVQVGQLVTGTVRRVEPFGVFVGIDNTRVSGLLHISNVSRQHIESVQVCEWAIGA